MPVPISDHENLQLATGATKHAVLHVVFTISLLAWASVLLDDPNIKQALYLSCTWCPDACACQIKVSVRRSFFLDVTFVPT
eukprot:SAG31_NODE_331_length_17518_cov_32.495042_16_plen_81_part_00